MAELENTNPAMDNPGNPVNPEPTSEPEETPDFSQLFSENIGESTPIQQSEPAPSVDTVATQPIQEESVASSEPSNQPSEAPVQETETPNFEKEIEHTTLDNSQNIQTAQQIAEKKTALEQQKLAWLKEHESKAKKSGFASGILSGILLMLLVFAACSVFAKDQVLTAMDYLNSLIPANITNTQVIENTEVLDNDIEETEVMEEEIVEEVEEIQNYRDIVDEIVSSEDNQESKVEQLRNVLSEIMQEKESDDELAQYVSQAIMDLTINTEEIQNEENNEIELEENINEETNNTEEIQNEENNENSEQELFENTNEEIIEENNENTEIAEESAEPYTITYVNSEEEANWVLPAHCSDLTCYGEDKEFVKCTSFKMVEGLDEDAHRIGNGGGCRYKDTSELVYVQFNE